MTSRNESAAEVGTGAARGDATCQKLANRSTQTEHGKVPHKWQRVLAAFLTGRSYNRFQAERELSDHCLHSTVSDIERKGVRISRKSEQVPGYLNIPTEVKRYWLELSEAENVAKARELVGGAA